MSRSNISNGALGAAFQICRFLQFACLIAAMGICARFVSELVDTMQQPPAPLIGVLVITCFATLYVIITYLLYFDRQLPALYTAASDTLFLIALLTSSVVVGQPLALLSCKAVGIAAAVPEKAFDSSKSFTEAQEHDAATDAAYLVPESGTVYHLRPRGIYMQSVDYGMWVQGAERSCELMKGVWGLAIALTILFAFSAVCLGCLWKKERAPKGKRMEDFEA